MTYFWPFGSINMEFCDFWMSPNDLVALLDARKQYSLSQYSIWTRSNWPKSLKWTKTFFWPFGLIKNAFSWFLNDYSGSRNDECCKACSGFIICNIKSNQQTKLQKMVKNIIFSSLDHPERYFCDFWMIQHGLYYTPHVDII